MLSGGNKTYTKPTLIRNEAVWRYSGSFENYMARLDPLLAELLNGTISNATGLNRRDDDLPYWLKDLGPQGIVCC
jgi:hypothetical protein